jgi:hypothetical protein
MLIGSRVLAAMQPFKGMDFGRKAHAAVHRWRRWLIAVAIVACIRALLPLALQHVIASQASKALHARVEVGDVDLALLRGGVALKEVAVFPANAAPESRPLIAWKRFSVELRWLPLFRKTIQLREVVLDSPYVSLERLKNGDLNLLALVPKASGEPTPAPTPAKVPPKPGWGLGVDRVVLRTGNLRFQDFMPVDSEPIEIRLPAIEVSNIAVRPGLYGQPAHASIEMKIDEGVLKIDSTATMREDGIAAETLIVAQQLPLRRSRVYIPKVGWSDLRGTVSIDLTHRIDTNGSRHDLRGTVGLQDLTVHVPGFEDTALAWRSLSVQIDPVDLVAQRVTVGRIALDGLSLPVRTGGKEPLPVLRAVLGTPGGAPAEAQPATASAQPTPPVEPSPVPSPAAAAQAPGKPWHWLLKAAQLTDAKLLVLHNTGRLDVGVAAEAHDLNGEGEQAGTVKLALGIGDGSLNLDGKVRLVPTGFAGHVVIDKLNLPDVVTASSAVAPEILPAGKLALDLNVDAGALAPAPGDVDVSGKIVLSNARVAPPAPKGLGFGVQSLTLACDPLHVSGVLASQPAPHQGDVRFHGKLSLSEPAVSAPGAKEPTASVKAVDLTLEDVSAPALLAKPAAAEQGPPPGDIRVRGKLNLVEPRVAAANAKEFAVAAKSVDVGFDEVLIPNAQHPKPGPMRVRLGDVSIASPNVQVTRTKEGIVLPQLTGAPAGSPQSQLAAAKESSPATTATPAAKPSFDISLAAFRLTKGRIAFSDRAVKPYYSGLISRLDIDVKGAHFPPMTASRVRLNATVAPQGTITAAGSMNPSGGTIELKVDDLVLTPFNPYANAYSSYGIGEGSLTVTTKAAFSSGGYKADSSIVLHNLDVAGLEGDSLFQQNFGIPLTVALALLKDMSGNIKLDVPVTADQEGMKVGIGTIVAGALRSALMGVLASPLKLIGLVVGRGKAPSAVPPEIAFRAGRADPTEESEGQIKQLAAFVASRPAIGVTLDAAPSTRDVRWLREQALAQELGKPQGVWRAVKNVGQGGKRERIAKALAERAKDEPGKLDEADSKTLEEWIEQRPSPAAEQIRGLVEARLAKLEHVLRDDYGVDASRITRGEVGADATDAPPAVRLEIGPIKKAAQGS